MTMTEEELVQKLVNNLVNDPDVQEYLRKNGYDCGVAHEDTAEYDLHYATSSNLLFRLNALVGTSLYKPTR